ncbi:MAG: hypothetical protein AMXMBFR47_14700 [Planctomycetota bacterium]
MPIRHRVQLGEGVSKIAFSYGRFPETVWNDPDNADLRARREDANMLVPGDVLVVHDLRPKVESAPTGETTKFVLKTTPALLRLQLAVGDEALADQPYVLTVDGVRRDGRTDGDGVMEAYVSPRAEKAVLTMQSLPAPIEISLGRLPPIDTLPGVKARLANLGYFGGELGDVFDDVIKAAILAFQAALGLSPSGDWQDEAFRDRLKALHDTVETPPEDDGSDGGEGGASGEQAQAPDDPPI